MPRRLRDFVKGAVEGAAACTLHRGHRPEHLTTEFHHVVPVAWQLTWQPAQPWPFPGRDPNGRGQLWDSRGVEVCPTGHRNVHYWIVKLMRSLGGGEDPHAAVETLRAEGAKTHGVEFATALLALLRWKEGGGSLQTLVAAKEWGES